VIAAPVTGAGEEPSLTHTAPGAGSVPSSVPSADAGAAAITNSATTSKPGRTWIGTERCIRRAPKSSAFAGAQAGITVRCFHSVKRRQRERMGYTDDLFIQYLDDGRLFHVSAAEPDQWEMLRLQLNPV
jgi:hypothetical protein